MGVDMLGVNRVIECGINSLGVDKVLELAAEVGGEARVLVSEIDSHGVSGAQSRTCKLTGRSAGTVSKRANQLGAKIKALGVSVPAENIDASRQRKRKYDAQRRRMRVADADEIGRMQLILRAKIGEVEGFLGRLRDIDAKRNYDIVSAVPVCDILGNLDGKVGWVDDERGLG